MSERGRANRQAHAEVLRVEGLRVDYRVGAGWLPAVRDVSLSIRSGEALGLVGESGSGKTTLGMAIMRYLPGNGRISGGSIHFDGADVVSLDRRQLSRLRGNRIAMVYQNPASALNPSMRVGEQVAEVYRAHLGLDRRAARARAVSMLELVQLPDPRRAVDRYPHQFSGGQKQRIVIGMALAMDPSLLILDEPTTGLDVTVEAGILRLFADLRATLDTAVLFISHDIGLVAEVCERVGVLHHGELVETGPTEIVFARPAHAYTRGLLACRIPPGADKYTHRLHPMSAVPAGPTQQGAGTGELAAVPGGPAGAGTAGEGAVAGGPTAVPVGRTGDRTEDGAVPLLEVRGLRKVYRHGGREVAAVAGASFVLRAGRILGVVGESGSGKTTLANMIAGLEVPDSGQVLLGGRDVTRLAQQRDVPARRAVQMVFQHPDGTLNPSHRVRQILRRQMRVLLPGDAAGRDEVLAAMLRAVRLEPGHLDARPAQLSGGQRQRVAIARAFCTSPDLVLLDEPTSALDVSVQASILTLLLDLQRQRQATYLLISHDLATVRYLADDILVMCRGEVVEQGPAAEVFESPQHPYTRTLLSAVLQRTAAAGDSPEPRAS